MLKTKTRFRKCRYCKEKTVPYGAMQPFCFENDCIREHNRVTKEKKIRKDKQTLKDQDKGYLTKKAQEAFNKYIRTRDKANPCISCDHTGKRQRHAGHYRPVGRNKQHRFNEMNCHSQCSICNEKLSGNLIPYRVKLISIYGLEKVEALECDNSVRSYDLEELREIIETYKNKFAEISEKP